MALTVLTVLTGSMQIRLTLGIRRPVIQQTRINKSGNMFQESIQQTTNALGPVGAIIALAAGVFLVMLAILWLIFPWFVHSKLTAIEKNTQGLAQSLEMISTTLNASHGAQKANEENTRRMANSFGPQIVRVESTPSPPLIKP